MPLEHSAADVQSWTALAAELGMTDFNPLTVDWNTPVPWGNNETLCNMDTQEGCLMPLSAGFAIVLGFGAFFSVVTMILTKARRSPLPPRARPPAACLVCATAANI